MGIRYSKRVGGNRGWGLNLSGSGISSSYRSKYGSIGAKGFSVRTGIPGLSFRSGWKGGRSKGNGAVILLAIGAFIFLAYISIVIAYNIIRLTFWMLSKLVYFSVITYDNWKSKRITKEF
jgi:hypothetical protein